MRIGSVGMIDKLRFLLYPSGLTDRDRAKIRRDGVGIVWLDRRDRRACGRRRPRTAPK